MSENDNEVLEKLAIAANVFQVGSFLMNIKQLSNDDIMKALDLQNANYLEKILNGQKEILQLLNNLSERIDKIEKLWYNINIRHMNSKSLKKEQYRALCGAFSIFSRQK